MLRREHLREPRSTRPLLCGASFEARKGGHLRMRDGDDKFRVHHFFPGLSPTAFSGRQPLASFLDCFTHSSRRPRPLKPSSFSSTQLSSLADQLAIWSKCQMPILFSIFSSAGPTPQINFKSSALPWGFFNNSGRPSMARAADLMAGFGGSMMRSAAGFATRLAFGFGASTSAIFATATGAATATRTGAGAVGGGASTRLKLRWPL